MSGERPGGWVDGIGWVALYGDLDMGDIAVAGVHQPPQSVLYIDSDCPIVVHRWADGSTPQAPTPPGREAAEVCPLHGKRHCACWRDGTGPCCSCGAAPTPQADGEGVDTAGHATTLRAMGMLHRQGLEINADAFDEIADWIDRLRSTTGATS